MSERLRNALTGAGITFLENVTSYTDHDLLKIPNLGQSTLSELKILLSSYNLSTAQFKKDQQPSTSIPLTQDPHNPEISCLDLSVRLKNALYQTGASKWKDVLNVDIERFSKIENIGVKTINELRSVQANKDVYNFLLVNPHTFSAVTQEVHHSPENDKNLDDIDISVRLKNALNKIGVFTFFELLSVNPTLFSKSGNVGKKTIEELISLQETGVPESLPNKDSQYEAKELLMLPQGSTEHQSFPNLCRNAFEEFCTHLDERDRAIAMDRIWPIDGKTITLESLGNRFDCSRERIRQIEKRLLNRMAKFFCHESPMLMKETNSLLILREELSVKWLKVTKEILLLDEIELFDFVAILERNFEISPTEILDIVQFTASIYSQSVCNSLKSELMAFGENIVRLRTENDALLEIQINKLRIGKWAQLLSEEFGIFSLGDVLEDSYQISNAARNKLNHQLSFLFNAKSTDGQVDWKKYCLQFNSNTDVTCESHEGKTIISKIRKLIPDSIHTKHADKVFELRTSKSTQRRKTLKEASIEIFNNDKLGPAVARLEKTLIEGLSKILISHDFSHCHTWVDQELLDAFSTAKELYRDAHDFDEFEKALVELFVEQEEGFAHLVWSIIAGLPPNRYFHLERIRNERKRRQSKDSSGPLPSKIKLKGFKRVF